MQRFTISGFTGLRSLQIGAVSATRILDSVRSAAFEGVEGELSAGRTIVHSREAGFEGLRGTVEGRSLARPDLSPGVTVDFEEV